MQKKIILAVYLFIPVLVSAQKYHISSRVFSTMQYLPGASVQLCAAKDSLPVKQAICDSLGFFTVSLFDSGLYFVKVTALGFKDYYSGIFKIPGSTNTLEYPLVNIVLEVDGDRLQGEVVVRGRRQIAAKNNRILVNVEAAAANAGSNMLEVIQKLPGVAVDNNGNISLNGRKGILVMVNNKPVNLTVADAAKYLSNLPSSSVSQVELLNNPSSRYDASGTAGIINLKLKFGKTRGYNGSFTANTRQGVYNKSGGDINLNYNNNKANVFFNGGLLYYRGFSSIPNTRRYFNASGTVTSFYNQLFDSKYKKPAVDINTGVVYSFNSRSSASLSFNGSWADERRTAKSSIQSFNFITNKVTQLISNVDTKNEWKKKGLSFSYVHVLDTTGGEFTTDLDYAVIEPGSTQLFDIFSYGSSNNLLSANKLQGVLPFTISLYAAKADFSKKISGKTVLSAGLKAAYSVNDNVSRYFITDSTGTWRIDSAATRQFIYKENVNAAYLTLKTRYRNSELEMGGRLENTNYTGRLQSLYAAAIGQGSAFFKRTYFSFFPFLNFTCNPAASHSFTFTAGRRIDRPDFYTLNPFTIFVDNYNTYVGNPFLKPQLSENIAVSHTYKSFFITTLYYNRTHNFFSTIYENQNDIIAGKYGNVHLMQNAGLSISFQKSITAWWSPFIYLNTGYFDYRSGSNINPEIHTTNLKFEANFSNELKLPGNISGELQFGYTSKDISLQGFDRSRWWLAIGFSKKLFNGQYVLRVNASDLFYTQNYRGNLFYANASDKYFYSVDSRAVGISLSRNFGSSANQKTRRISEGASEEKRVGAGIQ
jgi:iron complex outermembrane recepter protein